jgi:hypothetical protein
MSGSDPDPRIAQARQLHAGSLADLSSAADKRTARDELVRQLRSQDPNHWTYARLGREIGCSAELIALIVRGVSQKESGTLYP